jgi:hypothetical protein
MVSFELVDKINAFVKLSCAQKPNPAPLRLHYTMAGRSGAKPTAGFNRRMRKTACLVVWEGHGAQSL